MAILQNKTLSNNQTSNSARKKKSQGIFGRFVNYWKQPELDSIEVTAGKVKKNTLIQKEDLIKKLNQPESLQDHSKAIDFDQLRADINQEIVESE